jgi:hypothetical protein
MGMSVHEVAWFINTQISILSVRDRASLIDVLNENQRMQQW